MSHPNPPQSEERHSRKRDNQGRFDHEGDWDRLCVCGHTLGVHSAGSPADCLLHSFAVGRRERQQHRNQPPANCGCERFRPKKSKGKFIYLQREPLGRELTPLYAASNAQIREQDEFLAAAPRALPADAQTCRDCHGSGFAGHPDSNVKCGRCGGSGEDADSLAHRLRQTADTVTAYDAGYMIELLDEAASRIETLEKISRAPADDVGEIKSQLAAKHRELCAAAVKELNPIDGRMFNEISVVMLNAMQTIDRLAAALAEAENTTILRDQIDDLMSRLNRCSTDLAEERKKVERLAKALKAYGSHAASCRINNEWHRHKGCDCGLARALEQSR